MSGTVRMGYATGWRGVVKKIFGFSCAALTKRSRLRQDEIGPGPGAAAASFRKMLDIDPATPNIKEIAPCPRLAPLGPLEFGTGRGPPADFS